MKRMIATGALCFATLVLSLPSSVFGVTGTANNTKANTITARPMPSRDVDLVERSIVVQDFAGQGTIRFRDTHHGFSIQLPDSWELEEGFSDEHLDFVVVGVSPEEGPNDTFVENMNVLVEDVGDKISLNQYFMWNLIGLMQELPNFHVHEKVNVMVNDIKMSRIVYSWDLDKKRTATYQYIFVRGDKGYVLTFSADPGKFPGLRKTFDAVAHSFSFEGSLQ